MVGIYQITNKHNNKKYIGKSENIFDRWNKQVIDLINNKHPNKYLQKDFNKYGHNGFSFEILDICTTEELGELELDYISKLNSSEDYNITGLKYKIQNNTPLKIDVPIFDQVKEFLKLNYSKDDRIHMFQKEFNLTYRGYRRISNQLQKENIIYIKNKNTYMV